MYPSGKGFNPQTHQEEGTFQELFNQAIIRDSPTDGRVPWTKRYSNWARNERRRIKHIVKQWHHEEETGTIYSEDPYMGSWLQVCKDLYDCLAQEHLNQSAEEMLSAETSTTFPNGDSSKVSGTYAEEMEWIKESSESATAEGFDGEGGDMEAELEYGRGEERKDVKESSESATAKESDGEGGDMEAELEYGRGEERKDVEGTYEAGRGEERTQVEGRYEAGRGEERTQVEGTYEDGRGDESGEKFGNGREISQHIPEPGPVTGCPENPGGLSGEVARWPENQAECTEVSADPGQADRDNRWRAVE